MASSPAGSPSSARFGELAEEDPYQQEAEELIAAGEYDEDVRVDLNLRTMGGAWLIQTIGSLQPSPWLHSPGDGDATADIWMRHVVSELRLVSTLIGCR